MKKQPRYTRNPLADTEVTKLLVREALVVTREDERHTIDTLRNVIFGHRNCTMEIC